MVNAGCVMLIRDSFTSSVLHVYFEHQGVIIRARIHLCLYSATVQAMITGRMFCATFVFVGIHPLDWG